MIIRFPGTPPLSTPTGEDMVAHLGPARRYALVLTRDPDQAEDLVQEALARAIEAARTWRPGGDLRHWLGSSLTGSTEGSRPEPGVPRAPHAEVLLGGLGSNVKQERQHGPVCVPAPKGFGHELGLGARSDGAFLDFSSHSGRRMVVLVHHTIQASLAVGNGI